MNRRKFFMSGAILASLIFIGLGYFWLQKKSESNKQKNIGQNNSDSVAQDILPKVEDKNSTAIQSADNSNVAPAETVPTKPGETKTAAPSGTKPPISDSVPKSSTQALKIIDRLMADGFQKASGRTIESIIIHSSYDAIGSDPYDVNGIIAEYKSYGVSPHYIIDRTGNIYRLVKDQDIAYHAGVSKLPDGRTDVNAVSIGIEIITTKTASPTDAQYSAVQKLVNYLKGQYKIKYVLGHNQIAPGRKDDPWNFDWKKLN